MDTEADNTEQQQEEQKPAEQQDQSAEKSLQERLAETEDQLSRVLANQEKLMDETKAAKAAKREAEEQAAQQAEEQAKAEGNYEQLYNSSEQQRIELQAKLDERDKAAVVSDIKSEAAVIAAELTRDTSRAELLAEKIALRIDKVDGKLRVKDEGGNLTISEVGDLKVELSKKYPYLVDGSQAGGAGAQGNATTKQAGKTAFGQEAQDAAKAGDVAGFLNAAFKQQQS